MRAFQNQDFWFGAGVSANIGGTYSPMSDQDNSKPVFTAKLGQEAFRMTCVYQLQTRLTSKGSVRQFIL